MIYFFTTLRADIFQNIRFVERGKCQRKCLFHCGQVFEEPIFVPVFELVLALLDRVQFGQPRWEMPELEELTPYEGNRGIIDVLDRPLAADELPEVLGIEV